MAVNVVNSSTSGSFSVNNLELYIKDLSSTNLKIAQKALEYCTQAVDNNPSFLENLPTLFKVLPNIKNIEIFIPTTTLLLKVFQFFQKSFVGEDILKFMRENPTVMELYISQLDSQIDDHDKKMIYENLCHFCHIKGMHEKLWDVREKIWENFLYNEQLLTGACQALQRLCFYFQEKGAKYVFEKTLFEINNIEPNRGRKNIVILPHMYNILIMLDKYRNDKNTTYSVETIQILNVLLSHICYNEEVWIIIKDLVNDFNYKEPIKDIVLQVLIPFIKKEQNIENFQWACYSLIHLLHISGLANLVNDMDEAIIIKVLNCEDEAIIANFIKIFRRGEEQFARFKIIFNDFISIATENSRLIALNAMNKS